MLKRVLVAFGAVLLALGGISVAYARSHANPTLSVSTTRSFPGGGHPATADPTGLTGETGATGDESVTGTTGDQGDQSDQGDQNDQGGTTDSTDQGDQSDQGGD